MRRHPVLLGLCLFALVGLLFFVSVIALKELRGEGSLFSFRGKVGVVLVEGIIADAEEIVDQINGVAEDDAIRAVVLRIDSPGGGVAASQEIYQAARRLREKKRVVVSMGSVAASGGYLIATAADRIMANPGTITGSISAVMHFANVEELLRKVGVRSSVVKSGPFKDIGSPTREMTPEERKLIQGIVDDIYDQFVRTVSENRKIPLKEIEKLADGRIFTGRQAFELGLVDDLGGLEEAILLGAKLSGIEGKPAVSYAVRKRSGLLKYLLEGTLSWVSENIGRGAVKPTGIHYLYE